MNFRFRVLSELRADPHEQHVLPADSHGSTPASRRRLVGATHLAVDGAAETLCAEPVSRLTPVDGLHPRDPDVPSCWVCRLTART